MGTVVSGVAKATAWFIWGGLAAAWLSGAVVVTAAAGLAMFDSNEPVDIEEGLLYGAVLAATWCLAPLVLLISGSLINSQRPLPDWARYVGCLPIAVVVSLVVIASSATCAMLPR
jgi:hypothetical protein